MAVLVVAFALGAGVAHTIFREATNAGVDYEHGGEIRLKFDRWCPVASFVEGAACDVWWGGYPPPDSIHTELVLINGVTWLIGSAILLLPIPVAYGMIMKRKGLSNQQIHPIAGKPGSG